MFIHLLEKRLSKYVERLELELSHMEAEAKTSDGESRRHLADELVLMKHLAGELDGWNQRQMRKAVERLSLLGSDWGGHDE